VLLRCAIVEPYVSGELTERLRAQQKSLRNALSALEQRAGRGSGQALLAECRSVSRLFRTYEGLVNALLEAVEPDRPEVGNRE